MEAQLYRTVYRHVMSIAHPRRPRVQFNDHLIVLVYLWSVLHERPVCWACDEDNWPKKELSFQLPSDSTMSQRLETLSVKQLLERVLTAGAVLFPPTLVKAIDSKPLLVGAYSKDADAKRGRVAAGMFARGYRLNVLTHGRAVQNWTLAPMNDHDSLAAPGLLRQLRGGFGYVVADNAYDSNDLHLEAAAQNHQLVAPPREVNKGVRDEKHNCPQRLRALDLLDDSLQRCCRIGGEFGRELYNQREAVESSFGELSQMGLSHLPSWVRGPRRVAMWCAAKILIYLCRLAKKKGLIR
jgi:hypothetical protein